MTRILIRGDNSTVWLTENPVLMEREIAFETDTSRIKFGDGVSAWADLDYAFLDLANILLLLDNYAPIDSPTFTGEPKAPTAFVSDNDTQIATTEFVNNVLTDRGYATVASPTFTGDPKAPTPATGDNDTSIATTAFVKAQGYAPLASPALTGNPTAPTPTAGDADTSIATTAFVDTSFAKKASPVFTGNPTAPTPTVGDNDTSLATTAFVQAALAAAGTSGKLTFGTTVIQWGTASVSLSAAASGSTAVTFGTAYASAPTVFGNLSSATTLLIGTAQSPATSGLSAVAYHRDGSSVTATVNVAWLAIGTV